MIILLITALVITAMGFYNWYITEKEEKETYLVKVLYAVEIKENSTEIKDILLIKEDGSVIRGYYEGINSVKKIFKLSKEDVNKIKKEVSEIKIAPGVSNFGCPENYTEMDKIMFISLNVSGSIKNITICSKEQLPEDIASLMEELEEIKRKF